MELRHLIDTAWKGLDLLEAAGIGWTIHLHPQDVTKRYRADGQPPLPVGDDRMGNWYVDVRPYPGVPAVLTALEHAFGSPSRECTMDGERCLHWELGNIEVVATTSYLQLTLRQPEINSEPDPRQMVN